MEQRAWGYAVGGWRSASLEVGSSWQKSEVGGQPPSLELPPTLKLRRDKSARQGRRRAAVSKKTGNWSGIFGSHGRIGLDKVII